MQIRYIDKTQGLAFAQFLRLKFFLTYDKAVLIQKTPYKQRSTQYKQSFFQPFFLILFIES